MNESLELSNMVPSSDLVKLANIKGWQRDDIELEVGGRIPQIHQARCGHWYSGNRCQKCVPVMVPEMPNRVNFEQKRKRRADYGREYDRRLQRWKRKTRAVKLSPIAKIRSSIF